MKDGFIKVSAASPQIKIADCEHNTKQILSVMEKAAAKQVKLLTFPELCVTGYTCGDLFLQKSLLDGATQALLEIAKAGKKHEMLTVVGVPLVHNGKLYNCAVFIYKGNVLGVVPKKHLPNYNEFYEMRHFSCAPENVSEIMIGGSTVPFGMQLLFSCKEMPDFTIAAEICEDLWVPSPPSIAHATAGATVIVNLSASDETIGKEEYRRSLVVGQSARLVCAYMYTDAGEGESTTDMVFAGHNLIAENGKLLGESTLFEEGLLIQEIDIQNIVNERKRLTTFPVRDNEGYLNITFSMHITDTLLTNTIDKTPFVPSDRSTRDQRCELILSMQASGLKKRIEHIGCNTAIIGVSGGLDSCLALLVTLRAMDILGRPRENIIAVTMPCFGTTERTKNNAQKLCESLNVTFKTIDITDSVLQHFKDIGHDLNIHDTVFENAQARERTQILMDIANQQNGIVIGTGDLSESALGWSTYNGDHMSMYGVNTSVPKTLVRHIVQYAADTAESTEENSVLSDILNTPVSPELLPAKNGTISQKTEEIIGPYELHDFFLYYAIRRAFEPSKVLRLACHAFDKEYDKEAILKWLKVFYKRFFSQQFKRSCMPDGPKIGSVSLSPRADWRMPSDASVDLWLKDLQQN